MLDQQHGVLGAEPRDQGGDAPRFLRPHAGERFVEQQHLGFGRERHRHFELALFAMGKVGGTVARARLDARQRQRALRRRVDVAIGEGGTEQADAG